MDHGSGEYAGLEMQLETVSRQTLEHAITGSRRLPRPAGRTAIFTDPWMTADRRVPRRLRRRGRARGRPRDNGASPSGGQLATSSS